MHFSRNVTLSASAVGALALALLAGVRTAPAPAQPMAKNYPNGGWTLHIDAIKHFPGNKTAIAHHFCRPAHDGITECQLYDSDNPNAQLVGVEVVVPAATWKTFPAAEQASWHYHKVEIPKVNATMPDLSKEEAAKVGESLIETYGKVYLLWDPTTQNQPTGAPSISIVD